MDIKTLRNYRIELDAPFFNDQGRGIALFDLIGTFVIGYLINKFFNITKNFKITEKMYYGSLVPLGIIAHLFVKQDTFLNKQMFSPELNKYKVAIIALLMYTFNVYF